MTGTIVNTCAIIVGSIVGCLIGRGIKEKYKTVIYDGLGLASLGIGLNATLSHIGESSYPVLFIVAIALGGVVGVALDIDGRFHRIIEKHSGGKGDKKLADGLALTILLYCIGPLSMLGPVISALNGDNTFLYTNATLDFVSSIIFAATYGIGITLVAPVLFCWQSIFYFLTLWTGSAISNELMAELLILGGLLITGSGLQLLGIKDCKTLNLLPSLLVPIIWFALHSLFA